MNTRTAIIPLAGISLIVAGALVIAGPLDPPAGTIAPTYKTLGDVEPRIAVNAANTPGDADATPSLFKITQPGSYYLTGNITGQTGKIGIEIAADGVSLDLCGFAVQGAAGSLSGIKATLSGSEFALRNGTIRGWGGGGLRLDACQGALVESVTAASNIGVGIYVGSDSTISKCVSRSNTGAGIAGGVGISVVNCVAANNQQDGIAASTCATITGCVARDNGSTGIFSGGTSSIVNCTSVGNGTGGFIIGYGGTYNACTAADNDGFGFWVNSGGTASNCTAYENDSDGFIVYDGLVTECQANSNGRDGIRLDTIHGNATGNSCRGNGRIQTGAGVRAMGEACRIDSNHVSENDIGITAGANCIVVRNTARDNASGNYSFPSGSEYGQIITNPGNGFTSTNPWANFSY